MVFTSLKFGLFFAVTALVYFLLPKKARWGWLLAASAFFYLCAGLRYAVFLAVSILSAYAFGRYVGEVCRRRDAELAGLTERGAKKAVRQSAEKRKKRAVVAVLLLNLGILAVLKYADFVLDTLFDAARLFGADAAAPVLGLIAPLGLSFYTFIAVGYCIDVYREVIPEERNPLKLALFLSYFPHIMQGPIDRYDALAPQLFEGHAFDFDRVKRGLYRMLWGYFEKLVVADRLAILVDGVLDNYTSYSGLYLVCVMVAYAFQIYADFAGYMDIALGASKILGIELAENFDAPYCSTGIPEYWRRWHITLGAWFRDYLFYPIQRSALCKKLTRRLSPKLGKKRAALVCTCLALLVVWGATGLWHGASWHYLVWGLYYGVLIILSTLTASLRGSWAQRLHLDVEGRFWKELSMLRTFLLVVIGYVFFRAEGMTQALGIFSRILTRFPTAYNELGFSGVMDRLDLTVAVLGCGVLVLSDQLHLRKTQTADILESFPLFVRWAVLYAALTVVLLFGIYGPGYDAASFIYFNF